MYYLGLFGSSISSCLYQFQGCVLHDFERLNYRTMINLSKHGIITERNNEGYMSVAGQEPDLHTKMGGWIASLYSHLFCCKYLQSMCLAQCVQINGMDQERLVRGSICRAAEELARTNASIDLEPNLPCFMWGSGSTHATIMHAVTCALLITLSHLQSKIAETRNTVPSKV